MTFNGLRLEYVLEGIFNFIVSKDHMEVVLNKNVLLEYVKIAIAKPYASDTQNLAQWKKYVAKMMRIILDGFLDHIVLNIHGKETCFEMWN